MSSAKADLVKARDFILRNARLIDRNRFAFLFDAGSADAVVAALRPYQNEDGGFGNALEPDLRCSASQPVAVEHALRICDEVAAFEPSLVLASCDWLSAVSTPEGGVPFVLASVEQGPHAPWWKATGKASLNPTAGIAGLLHKHHVTHTWLPKATAYCWDVLHGDGLNQVGPDDAISILMFLEHVPEKERAKAVFERLKARIRSELVALDPAASGYVKMPLEFAPAPRGMAGGLFDPATIGLHLDALEAKQRDDGGWPITWVPPSAGAVSEWRSIMTIKWLDVLHEYGRLVKE